MRVVLPSGLDDCFALKRFVVQTLLEFVILNNLDLDYFSLENIVGMSVTEGMDTAFGSRTRKGMFRTVSQLYKVSVFRTSKRV